MIFYSSKLLFYRRLILYSRRISKSTLWFILATVPFIKSSYIFFLIKRLPSSCNLRRWFIVSFYCIRLIYWKSIIKGWWWYFTIMRGLLIFANLLFLSSVDPLLLNLIISNLLSSSNKNSRTLNIILLILINFRFDIFII